MELARLLSMEPPVTPGKANAETTMDLTQAYGAGLVAAALASEKVQPADRSLTLAELVKDAGNATIAEASMDLSKAYGGLLDRSLLGGEQEVTSRPAVPGNVCFLF
jgi:hypothetical protein